MDNFKNIIEALIFASETPLAPERLAQILSPYPIQEIENRLNELTQEYNASGRGIQLVKVAGGYQFTTQPQLVNWINKLFKEKEKRGLSPAALETLAIVAYKQPIMRVDVEVIRGVDASGILHALLEKNLICITGRGEGPGKPLLYGTTEEFLLFFGLHSISDLPKPEEIAAETEKIEAVPAVS